MSASILELIELYTEYQLEQQQLARTLFAHGKDQKGLPVGEFGGFMDWLKKRAMEEEGE